MAIQTDGFATTLTLITTGAISTMEIKSITPPGVAGGGAIDTTTMSNSAYRTAYPKSLKTLAECSLTVAYDPDLYTTILAAVNVNQEMKVTFPDSTVLTFWGFIDSFTPAAQAEGEQPTADLVLIPTNLNGSQAEIAPVRTL